MAWRPRWNLRMFLGFILVAGCVIGIFGRRELQRRREAAAVKALAKIGVQVRYGDGANEVLHGPVTGVYVYDTNNPGETTSVEDLASLRDLRYLKVLHFSCKTLSHDTIHQLKSLPDLEELNLSYFPVDDAMLESIGNIASLKQLHIDDSQMTVDGIKHLAKLQKLETLNIQRMNQSATGLEGAGKFLARITTLRDLSLKADVTSDDLKQLSSLKQLQTLNLQVPQLTADDIAEFAKCPQLKSLSIYHVNGGNEYMEAIGKLIQLEHLNCGLVQANDDGVEHLKSLKKLKKLTIIHTAATERSVEILSELPDLAQIQLGHPQLPGGKLIGPGKSPPWPAGSKGSGIFERSPEGGFQEMTNAEIQKRGYW